MITASMKMRANEGIVIISSWMNTCNKVDKTNSDIHHGLRKKSQEI